MSNQNNPSPGVGAEEELKPCGSCDSNIVEILGLSPTLYAACMECDQQSGYYQTRSDAIAAWNRRAPVVAAAGIGEQEAVYPCCDDPNPILSNVPGEWARCLNCQQSLRKDGVVASEPVERDWEAEARAELKKWSAGDSSSIVQDKEGFAYGSTLPHHEAVDSKFDSERAALDSPRAIEIMVQHLRQRAAEQGGDNRE